MNSTQLPPQDLVAEQSVLGACILHGEAIDTAALILLPEHFYSEKHQVIYRAVLDMREQNRQVDVLTLADELSKRKHLKEIGGGEYLNELMNAVPHTAHTDSYAGIVLDRSRRRSALEAGSSIIRTVYDIGADTDSLLAEAESLIHSALEFGTTQRDISIEGILLSAITNYGEPAAAGLDLQIPSADQIVGGMQAGSLVTIAASTSVGKTSLGMGILKRLAEISEPGCLMSYEMTAKEIADRMIASATGLTIHQLRRGPLSQSDRNNILHEAQMMSALPLFIDDQDRPLPQLLVTMRTLARKRGIKVFVVDYLQKVPSGGKFQIREQEVAHIARQLKGAAKSLGVTIIALAQLNRNSELRDNQEPRLSDLRESAVIAQESDTVMLLWRPNKDSTDQEKPDDHGILIVAKNRQGKLGRVKLRWNGARTMYSDWDGATDAGQLADDRVFNWRSSDEN